MAIDVLIITTVLISFCMIPNYIADSKIQYISYIILSMILIIVIFDLIISTNKSKQGLVEKKKEKNLLEDYYGDSEDITEILLLNEDDEPIKSWNLADCVSLIIGRDNPDTNVDIDLDDGEYSALIDYNHAVLNYACGSWFIEDLYSENGVRVKTRKDGECYKLAKDRPCKLAKGDIVLIANTKLLLR